MPTSIPNKPEVKEVHILPRRPGQTGHTEVHCLQTSDGEEDTCILVHVRSRSTLVSELSSGPSSTSDDSLQAYVDKAKKDTKSSYASDGKTRDSIDVIRRSVGYDKYDEMFEEDSEYNVEQMWMEHENQAGESSKPPMDCMRFMDPVKFVKEMVNQICEDGEAKSALLWSSLVESLKDEGEVTDDEDDENLSDDNDDADDKDNNNYYGGGLYQGYKESIDYVAVEPGESMTNWPTIGEFNVELGALKIDEYLSNFETDEDWLYVIYYKGLVDQKCSELHKYQAIYSLPTWKYPVAQATASIFFTIEVSKALFPHCSVDVTFQYETFRQVYSVGTNELHEKWLQYILDSKIKFFQTITY